MMILTMGAYYLESIIKTVWIAYDQMAQSEDGRIKVVMGRV